MLTTRTFKFLSDLKKNNNREWFQENRHRYEAAKLEFEVFIETLIPLIARFDKETENLKAKKCIFRIYRDIRFSKNKSPYKSNLGAYIKSGHSRPEIQADAGYYIHIEPAHSILAGGAYNPSKEWLIAIRREIDYNASSFKKIIHAPRFKKYFGALEGDQLIRPPKGYEAFHPEIKWLKHKSLIAVHHLSDRQVQDKKFVGHCAEVFKALYPLNTFLNEAD